MTALSRRTLSRRSLATGALAAALPTFADAAAPRFAVVIGNCDYDGDGKVDTSEAAVTRAEQRGLAGDLQNPWFDTVRVGEALRGAGFEVDAIRDADPITIKAAAMRLYARAQAAGPTAATLFYYAGHGIQLGGRNYLVGVRGRFDPATMPTQTAEDRERVALQLGAPVQEILSRARAPTAPGYNLIMLDACRDNPWEDQMRRAFAQEGRDYVGERGFVAMSVLTPRTVLSFSSSPGQLAMDGPPGAGSPYANAVVEAIQRRGAPLDQVIDAFMGRVSAGGGGRQSPWRMGRIGDATPL